MNITEQVYREFVLSRTKHFPTDGENLLHSAVGLVGEAIELFAANSRDNILEELGDMEFYLAQAKNTFPIFATSYEEYENLSLQDTAENCHRHFLTLSGEILDYAKKTWVYGKPLELGIIHEAVHLLDVYLDLYTDLLGTTRPWVRAMNVIKLKQRFPDGYTDAAALARADKALLPNTPPLDIL